MMMAAPVKLARRPTQSTLPITGASVSDRGGPAVFETLRVYLQEDDDMGSGYDRGREADKPMKQLDDGKLRSRQRNAYIALYVIGGLTLLLGLIAELGRVDVLLQYFGSGWFVAVEGAVVIVLGYFTMRGSMIALGIAIALYTLDMLTTLALSGGRGLSGIVVRILVLYLLVQGFLAMRELKRRSGVAAAPSSATPPPA